MGSGRFDSTAYAAYSATTVGKTTEEIYTARTINKNLDPWGVKQRESRDSADNPNSTPVIVALDGTGSMHMIADALAREGLGTLFTAILDRKPISDPHVMFMMVGDAHYDSYPLQVSQFEADMRIVEQLTQLYIEHGGGGNDSESYNLPWYFAGFHTVHDAMEKRGKKGYLFTIGDEEFPEDVTRQQLKKIIGDDVQGNMSSKDMLEIAQRSYNIYHVIIEEGSYARRHLDRVVSSWGAVLGQNVIRLADYKKLSETIVSAIEVAEGVSAEESAKRWGADHGVVYDAIKSLPRRNPPPLLGA